MVPEPRKLPRERMIKVTRLDGSTLVVNADLILFVESTPDTVIRLTTGERILVKESVDELIRRVLEFSRSAGSRPLYRPGIGMESA